MSGRRGADGADGATAADPPTGGDARPANTDQPTDAGAADGHPAANDPTCNAHAGSANHYPWPARSAEYPWPARSGEPDHATGAVG